MKQHNKYKKYWNRVKKNDSKLDEKQKENVQFERTFLAQHIEKYFKILDSIPETGNVGFVDVSFPI